MPRQFFRFPNRPYNPPECGKIRIAFTPTLLIFISVGKVQQIKEAIDRLTLQERCELMALHSPESYDAWDRQMVSDSAPGGKLEQLKQTAHKDFQDGKCKECPEGEIPRPS